MKLPTTYSHGHAIRGRVTETYRIWRNMRYRCRHKNNPRYYYMNADIEVCERWNSYTNFLADMGERPKGLSLDRIDNTKGYSPDNCRWASNKQQQNNRRDNLPPIEFNGITKTLPEWAEYLGIAYKVLWGRLYTYKWPLEKALRKETK